TAVVSTSFANPLVVKVTDSFANPVPGVTVTFAGPTTGAGASFPSGPAATTDGAGQAALAVAPNTVAGPYGVTATATGVGTPASFGLTNNPGAGTIALVSGGSQSAAVGTAFADPLVVKVTDTFGNGVPGVTVTFAGPSSGAGVTFPGGATAITDPSGRAGVALVANTVAGSYAVTATAPGAAAPASFALTNTPAPPAAVVVASGGGQSAAAGTAYAGPLVARVTDQF